MLTDIGLKQSRSLTSKINLDNFTAKYKFFFSVFTGVTERLLIFEHLY